ncbi:amino acid ABC transporter substrate-binding protein [Undibacterium fentianense]|uniref:Amino acid ABC transporter substrate-binding protein n=1 Tax=Undibacterium fentianense TaxID=2828728 RepID=A0A941E4C2_9BURK|nr:amino acid ABC transporter substrate-binding protein [Undibacterium fentianense]MBR7800892.1 amino acid ABC transporter substrate-binding protein [Undibacterium fentianense]
MFKYLCFSLTLLFAIQVHAADTLARIKERKTIVIAHREASVPISYLSEDSKPIGYAMDICSKVVERIKRDLKQPQITLSYLLVNSSNRFSAIQDASADLECGTTANTAERRKQVAFSIPYFFSATRFLIKADSSIKNWSDLTQKRVAIVRGSTASGLLRQLTQLKISELKLMEVSHSRAGFELLQEGQVDALVAEEVVLAGLRASMDSTQQWKIVGEGIGIEAQTVMFAKDDPVLKVLVDKEIARMINEGELVKIYDKWFTQALPGSGVNLALPMSFLLRDSLRFPSDKVLN